MTDFFKALGQMFAGTPEQIWGQIIGLFGLTCTVLSYQTKKPRNYCLLQGTSGAFFTVSFLLLGSPTSAILNFLNVLRGGVFAAGKRLHKPPVLVSILALNTLATAGTLVYQYRNPTDGRQFVPVLVFALLTWGAQIVTSFAMWSNDGRFIRTAQFLYVSPAWLANNIYFASVPGILCESFTMVSIVVSLIRFGWSGLARGAAGTGTEESADAATGTEPNIAGNETEEGTSAGTEAQESAAGAGTEENTSVRTGAEPGAAGTGTKESISAVTEVQESIAAETGAEENSAGTETEKIAAGTEAQENVIAKNGMERSAAENRVGR